MLLSPSTPAFFRNERATTQNTPQSSLADHITVVRLLICSPHGSCRTYSNLSANRCDPPPPDSPVQVSHPFHRKLHFLLQVQ